MEDVWVALYLSSESDQKVYSLRDSLRDHLPVSFNHEPDRPHVSILPRVRVPTPAYEQLTAEVESTSFPGEPLQIENLTVFPFDRPYVITLDVTTDFRQVRKSLMETVYGLDGRVVYPPVDPHITLFKSANNPEEARRLSAEEMQQLYRLINQFNKSQAVETDWVDHDYSITLSSF